MKIQTSGKPPWAEESGVLCQQLGCDTRAGLTGEEAARRLKAYGANRLVKERQVKFWAVFKEEVAEPLIILLLIIAVVYSIWGELRDAITIFAVVVTLVFVEIVTEYRAKKAVAALRKLSPPMTPVLRDGGYQNVLAVNLVKGDIIMLEVGGRVPADARVIESFGLEVDESALTGESAPVPKEDRSLATETPLAERANMVFAGTTVTRGRARAVVTATGMETELGRITGLVLESKEPKTPLQLAMKQLAGLLIWVAVFFSVAIPLIGFFQGKPYKEMVLTGLSLSFATIPEELPIIITMVLGMGALALSKKNVLIRRLRAAETLGDVTVIATDKTGTITENRMAVTAFATDGTITNFAPDGLPESDKDLLEMGALTSCLDKAADGCFVTDPLERALLEAATALGMKARELQTQAWVQREFSFDSRRKMMSAVFVRDGQPIVYAKGAPEVLLSRSAYVAEGKTVREKTADDVRKVIGRVEQMAQDGMRVLAFAYKKVERATVSQDEAESALVFAGLVGLLDPPREGVKEALQTTRAAGIRTIMVSGDHPLTVRRIASDVGIDSGQAPVTGAELEAMTDSALAERLKQASVFARITPDQKLRIVRALQASGELVAVTGDGINDAPALKSADIGIAMGETGTEVAREAAAMVLRDDSFTSIAAGVREGRKIFDNLKKGVTYYLSVKIALVLTFAVPLILNIPFPFAPIQIILLELFMDLAASATFVAEPIEPSVMLRQPRRQQKFVDRLMVTNMALGCMSLAAAVLFNYLRLLYTGAPAGEAQTVAFATWLVGHVFLAFTMRSDVDPLWKVGVFSNRVMLLWTLAVVAFLLAVSLVPGIQGALRISPVSAGNWLLVIVVPFITIFWREIKKAAS